MARPSSIAAALASLCLTGGLLTAVLCGCAATETEVSVAPTNAFAFGSTPKEADAAPEAAAAAVDRSITPKEALAFMDDGKSDVVVLDVRTEQEYEKGHLEHAILLPYNLVDEKTAEAVIPHKDDPVIVYCQSGRRSKIAVDTLAELGYTQVYDLGSIKGWPYEIVADDAEEVPGPAATTDNKKKVVNAVRPPLYRQTHLVAD